MTVRSRRPVSIVLPALALVVLAAAVLVAVHYRHNVDKAFTIAGLGLIGGVAVLILPDVEPVYPISAGFAASLFSGYWGQMGIPLGLDKPLILYGIAAVFVQALLDQRRRVLPTMTSLGWLLVLVSVYAIGSAAVSGTLTNHNSLFALLDQFGLIGFALFILAPSIFATERERTVLLITLIAAGAYVGWVSFFEGVHVNGLVFPSYLNNPNLGINAGRSRGPFMEAAANGLALYACSVAAAMGVAKWWNRPVARLLCGLVVLLCVAGILFTLTRQVWVGSGVATAITMALQRRLRAWLIPSAVLTAVLVLLALAFVPGLKSSASARANDNRSVWDRLNSDAAGLRMLNRYPLLGVGYYKFGPDSIPDTNSIPYYHLSSTYPLTTVGRIHNVFLATAVDLGILGFVLWLCGLLGAIYTGLRRRGPPEGELWRFGLIAVAVDWIVVANFTPLGYAFPNHLIWMWCGVAFIATNGAALGRKSVSAPNFHGPQA